MGMIFGEGAPPDPGWKRVRNLVHRRRLPALSRIRFAVLSLALLTVVALPSSTHALDVDGQGWIQMITQGRLAGRLNGYLEVQPRLRGGDGLDIEKLLVRPAFFWQATPEWSFWLGYNYAPTFHPYRDEQQVWQQAMYLRRFPRFSLLNRTRLEQRMLSGAGGVAVRLRHQVRAMVPLPSDPAWALVAFDEAFFHMNTVSSGAVSGFDQNRFFLGISRQLTPQLRAEVGYQTVFVLRAGETPDRLLHVALTSIVLSF